MKKTINQSVENIDSLGKSPKYPVLTVIKALDIIDLLAKGNHNKGMSISEFSNKLGIGKSTVHRILDTLVHYNYIEKDKETLCYRLGWKFYYIGQIIPRQNHIFSLNADYLIELGKLVKETVNIGVLSNGTIVIISKFDGSNELLQVDMRNGIREPVHATALGKVLISEMSREELTALIENRSIVLEKLTARTIDNIEDLVLETARVRKNGYAVDNEEMSVGLICLARPLRDYTGKIVAALSISTPKPRFNESRKKIFLSNLSIYSAKISQALGYDVDKAKLVTE